MPNRKSPSPSRKQPKKAGFDAYHFIAECWQHATLIAAQEWGQEESEYPGHDPVGSATMEFGVVPFRQRLLVLSNQDFDDDNNEERPKRKSVCLVRVCDNIPSESKILESVIEKEKFDGWQFRWETRELPTHEKSEEIKALLSRFYLPLPGSDVSPELLLNIISFDPNPVSGDYLAYENGQARLKAIAGFQTGVTRHTFIYDQGVLDILKTFQVPTNTLSFVGQTRIEPTFVKSLNTARKRELQNRRLWDLKTQLTNAQETVKSLRREIREVEGTLEG